MGINHSLGKVSTTTKSIKRYFFEIFTLWRYIIQGRAGQVSMLLTIMMIAAVLEMATLVSVLPLVSALVDSQSSDTSLIALNLPVAISRLSQGVSNSSLFMLIALIVSLSALFRIVVILSLIHI